MIRTLLLGTFGLLALTLIGCSGTSPLGTQTGPSSFDGGAGTFTGRDTAGPSGVFLPPTGNPANSCENMAPTMLRANAQPSTPGASAAILIDWRPTGRAAYEVSVDRRDPSPALVFVVEGTTQDTRRYQPGVYDVRVRARAHGLCAEPGLWSAVVTVSLPDYPQPAPVVVPTACGSGARQACEAQS